MKDGPERDAALVIGFGPPEGGGGEGPMIMRAWARAMKSGDWEKAWSLFGEAIAAADDAHGDMDKDEDESPFGAKEKRGMGDDDEGDLEF